MSKRLGIILLLVAAGCIFLWVISGSGSGRRAQPGLPSRSNRVAVVYRLTGQGQASITYRNGTGGTDQANVALPWEQKFDVAPGAILYLSAQTERVGQVTCSITVGGAQLSAASAANEFRIATCQGSAK